MNGLSTARVVAGIVLWILFTLIIYAWNFDWTLSKSHSDWGAFGSYLTGMLTFPFSGLAVYFAYRSYSHDKEKYSLSASSNQIMKTMEHVDKALSLKVSINDNSFQYTYGEVCSQPDLFKIFNNKISSDEFLLTRFLSNMWMPCVSLYAALQVHKIRHGEDDVFRTAKNLYSLQVGRFTYVELMMKRQPNTDSILEMRRFFEGG